MRIMDHAVNVMFFFCCFCKTKQKPFFQCEHEHTREEPNGEERDAETMVLVITFTIIVKVLNRVACTRVSTFLICEIRARIAAFAL